MNSLSGLFGFLVQAMNDTSLEMESHYRALIMERSGEERLKMGS